MNDVSMNEYFCFFFLNEMRAKNLPQRLPSMVCCIMLPVGHVMLYASIPLAIGCRLKNNLTLFVAIFPS